MESNAILDRLDRRSFLKATGGTAAGVALAGCTGSDEEFITIGTGGTGGTYYPLGGGIAEILTEQIDRIDASAESTGAGVENNRLVAEGEMDMALSMSNAVINAQNGDGDFDESLPVISLFGSYLNHTQIVTLDDTDITSVPDLEGHDVSIGAPGSGTETMADEILDFYGMSFDDLNDEQLSFDETAQAMQDDQLDAGFLSVAYPTSAIDELATQRDIRLIDFDEDEIEDLSEEQPHYASATIPAETYPGQDDDVTNPAMTNTMIVNEDMGEDLAYEITEAIYENLDDLENIHHVAEEFPEAARNAPGDLHPGSETYFDDAGI